MSTIKSVSNRETKEKWKLAFDDGIIRMSKGICIDSDSASTLTEECDTVGIASEVCDIIVNPLNSRVDIEKTKILRFAFDIQLWSIGLSEDVESIIERYYGDIFIVSYHLIIKVGRTSCISDGCLQFVPS